MNDGSKMIASKYPTAAGLGSGKVTADHDRSAPSKPATATRPLSASGAIPR